MPKNSEKKTEWMMLSNGNKFYPLEPDIELIEIHDIAISLSLMCRYIGKTQVYYSVAEHSVHVSHLVSPKNAFWGLMHDAAEAYVGDMPWPIKLYVPKFVEIENQILKLIAEKYGLNWPIPIEIKTIDSGIIVDEMLEFFNYGGPFSTKRCMTGKKIRAWTPDQAKRIFLNRFFQLRGELL